MCAGNVLTALIRIDVRTVSGGGLTPVRTVSGGSVSHQAPFRPPSDSLQGLFRSPMIQSFERKMMSSGPAFQHKREPYF